MFVMSMYANKADLHAAKSTYYMEKSKRLQKELKRQRKLVAECMTMINNAELIVPFEFRQRTWRRMPRAKK
jgi:hypothetical protein